MGGQPKQTTTTQKVEPWDAAKPYFETLYGAAQTAFQNTDRTPYTGDLYATPNATQQQALDLFRSAAGGAGTGAAPTRALAMDTINGKYMDPASNPWLAGAVEAARRPLENQLMRQILPSIEDQSIAQGAFGGAGNGTARGLAVSDFTQQALDMANRTYAENYARERAYQMQAPALFAAGDQMSLLPAQLMDLAGSQQQGWDQAALDANLQRYNINQAAPWAGLGEWAQILNGGGFSSAGTTARAPTSGMASFLQGAAGVGGLASSLMGSGGGDWLSRLFSGGGGGMSPTGGSWATWG
jgi:hypothetical protein